MATFIKAATNPTAPVADSPYVEKDWAIVRGVTKALFDFSHPDSFSQAATMLKGGDTVQNLVEGGAAAQVQPTGNPGATAPLATGMVRNAGASLPAQGPILLLGAAFFPAATTRRMLLTTWLHINSTGNVANQSPGIIGAGTGNGAAAAYQVYCSTNAAGAITEIRFRVHTGAAPLDTLLTGAALAAALDGIHQLGFAFEIKDNIGQGSIYVDGALAVTGPVGAMTQFNQPGGAASFPAAPGVGSFALNLTNAKWARPGFHDLTGKTKISFAAMLARDIESATGNLA